MNDLSKLPSDPPLEQQAIHAKCVHSTGTFVEFKEEGVEQSIPDRFEQQVANYPDRVAVIGKTVSFTYEALNKLANRLARAILNQCGQGAEPIALLFEQGTPVIAAILGVLKAGKICVPLDPSYPRARISHMLEDSQAALIVTNNRQHDLARVVAQNSRQLLDIDALGSSISDENLGISLPPETPYGIFYTSGSTGEPKGVVDNHRNMLYHIMAYTNAIHICAEDRLTLLHSLSFRAAEMHLFGALLNGAALFPLDLKETGIGNLAAWLNHQGITVYHSIPMVFRQFAQTLTGKLGVPTLRLIHLSGAAASRREVELYKEHFGPQCLFLHRMGFTEGYTVRWYFMDQATQIAGNRVPVGYPVGKTQVLLVNEAGKEVGPEGEIGEIAVKSRYLSPGYWRRPDLTEAAFLADPAGGNERIYRTGDLGRIGSDGCLEHLGRKDFQVKIRGYRIDVAEIESALLDHAAIKEAVVTARQEASGDTVLVAYLVPVQGCVPPNSELRRFLQVTLPDYMVPSAFVTLEALPLTPNGKLDYRALPARERLRPELEVAYVAPKSEIEQDIATIWQEVLSLEKVGVQDNFFDLGGHSLLLAKVQSKLQAILQRDLPIVDLFEHPTINTLVRYVSQQQRGQATSQPNDELVEHLRVGKNRRRQLSQRRERTRGIL